MRNLRNDEVTTPTGGVDVSRKPSILIFSSTPDGALLGADRPSISGGMAAQAGVAQAIAPMERQCQS